MLADPPAIRHLMVGHAQQWGPHPPPPGPLAPVVIPPLRELWTYVQSLPALLRGDFELPALEKLVLGVARTSLGDGLFAPESILVKPPTTLTGLRIQGYGRFGEVFVTQLARLPLAGQLTSLHIKVDAGGRAALREHAAAFVHVDLAPIVHESERVERQLAELAATMPHGEGDSGRSSR